MGMSTDATPPVDPPLPDAALLPDDPAVLKQLVVQLLAELQKARARLERQEYHMHLLLKRLYGSTSEKRDPRQSLLFDAQAGEGETPVSPPAPPPATAVPAASPPSAPQRDKHGRGRIPGNIERQEEVHDLTDAEKVALGGAENLVELPPERSEQLDWRPSTLLVIVHVRKWKSGDTIRVSLISWPTAFLGFQHAADKPLQSLQERLVPEWATRAAVPAELLQLLLPQGTVQQGVPVANHRQQGAHLGQTVVAPERCARALLHRHSPALSASRARTGFNSTYRAAASK